MVKTLEHNRNIKAISKSKELGKTIQPKSKLEWANEVAINADLDQIKALL